MSDGFSISGVNQKMCWISHDITSAALPRQQWRNVITYNAIFFLIFEICTIYLIWANFHADAVKFEKKKLLLCTKYNKIN